MNDEEAFFFAKKNPERRHEVIQFITTIQYAYEWLEQFPEDKNEYDLILADFFNMGKSK